MKPRLWSATVTIKLDVVIVNNEETPTNADVLMFAFEELSQVGSDTAASIEGPHLVASIADVPSELEDSVPWGPIDDNPEDLTVEEILSLPEPKPVEPFGEQQSLTAWGAFVPVGDVVVISGVGKTDGKYHVTGRTPEGELVLTPVEGEDR
jgi:hypothetical protein